MSLRIVWLVLASLAIGAALSACESVTNLDVTYEDASASASDGGDAEAAPPGAPIMFPGCPCDEAQGLGCCIPKVGTPFCTADTDFCKAQKGTHLKCGRPDPTSESACCWHFSAPEQASGAVTALAGACDGGTTACTNDSDCAGTGAPCKTATCAGVVIGQCGAEAPPCAR